MDAVADDVEAASTGRCPSGKGEGGEDPPCGASAQWESPDWRKTRKHLISQRAEQRCRAFTPAADKLIFTFTGRRR